MPVAEGRARTGLWYVRGDLVMHKRCCRFFVFSQWAAYSSPSLSWSWRSARRHGPQRAAEYDDGGRRAGALVDAQPPSGDAAVSDPARRSSAPTSSTACAIARHADADSSRRGGRDRARAGCRPAAECSRSGTPPAPAIQADPASRPHPDREPSRDQSPRCEHSREERETKCMLAPELPVAVPEERPVQYWGKAGADQRPDQSSRLKHSARRAAAVNAAAAHRPRRTRAVGAPQRPPQVFSRRCLRTAQYRDPQTARHAASRARRT